MVEPQETLCQCMAVCSDNDKYFDGGYKALTSPCMLHGPVLGGDMSLLMMATAK